MLTRVLALSGARGHGGGAVAVADRAPRAQRSSTGASPHVPGIRVGHFTLTERPTGCTVVLVDGDGAVGRRVAARRRPGTRETDLLDPLNMVDKRQRDRAVRRQRLRPRRRAGRRAYLEERQIGWNVGAAGVVPIVPAAILFDLGFGGDSEDPADGRLRLQGRRRPPPNGAVAEGNVGAGAGATVGKMAAAAARAMKGGIGSASDRAAERPHRRRRSPR